MGDRGNERGAGRSVSTASPESETHPAAPSTATPSTRSAYRVLGTTDDFTVCELCGRDDLKGTVVLQALDLDGNDDGEPVHYGSDCGARAARWSLKEIRSAAHEADRKVAEAAAALRWALSDAEQHRWEFYLIQATGLDFGQQAFAAIGGFGAAHDAYQEWLACGEPTL